MSRRKPPLTELGRALRERDADLRSGWERDYGGAIRAALAGDAARLLDLLRAHRRPVTADALTDVDLDRLADFIEVTAKRPPGRERDPAVHAAARIAATLLSTRGGKVPAALRERAIEKACAQAGREYGAPVNRERVRDLLNRPKTRRAP